MHAPTFTDLFGLMLAVLGAAAGALLLTVGLLGLSDVPLVLAIPLGVGFIWFGLTMVKETLRWLALVPEKHVRLAEDGLFLGREFVNFDDITSVSSKLIRTEKRLNFVKSGEDHTCVGSVLTNDGRKLGIRGGQGPTTRFGPSLGKSSASRAWAIISFVDQRTADLRFHRMVNAFSRDAYLSFDSKRIDANGVVHFAKDRAVSLENFKADHDDPFTLKYRAKGITSALMRFFTGPQCTLDLQADREPFLRFAYQEFKIGWPTVAASVLAQRRSSLTP